MQEEAFGCAGAHPDCGEGFSGWRVWIEGLDDWEVLSSGDGVGLGLCLGHDCEVKTGVLAHGWSGFVY